MSEDSFYLGIDQGTQSSRAIVFDQTGRIIAKAQVKICLETRPNDYVEQQGDEILQSIQSCLESISKKVNPEFIKTAGLATQRSSVIAWNRITGETAGPLISWRDRRATDFITSLKPQEDKIQAKSGLRLTPYYGGSKIRWLLQNNTQVQQLLERKQLLIGPLASYLVNRLCENHPYQIDHANALRMQLLNQHSLKWDEDLCDWFEVATGLLPTPVFTNQFFGNLKNLKTPLSAVNGDQTAAMYSQGTMLPDECIVNLGTGGFVLCPVRDDAAIPAGMLGGVSMSNENTKSRLIEGTVNGCGAALNWYKNTNNYQGQFDLDNCLKNFSGDLLFMNGVNGLGSPLWRSIDNQFLHASTLDPADSPERNEAVAAIVESILFLIRLNIETMQSVVQPESIRLSGGLANSEMLCQRLADLCEIKVRRPQQTEATARGIAWLSSGMTKHWPTTDLVLTPEIDNILQSRYLNFLIAVNQAKQKPVD